MTKTTLSTLAVTESGGAQAADLPPIVQREIFGPIAPIVTWTSDEEVLQLANGTEMGLAAYVYSGDLQRAMRLGEAINAGMVGINRGLVSDPSAPFGGMLEQGWRSFWRLNISQHRLADLKNRPPLSCRDKGSRSSPRKRFRLARRSPSKIRPTNIHTDP